MITFCGIDNPHGGEGLSPSNPGSAGRRLYHLAGSIGEDAYRQKFRRVNAKDEPLFQTGETVIVLGLLAWARITKRFDLPRDSKMMVWHTARGIRFAMIPHPSGLNHWYNLDKNRNRVERFIATTVKENDKWQSSQRHALRPSLISTMSGSGTTGPTTSLTDTSSTGCSPTGST